MKTDFIGFTTEIILPLRSDKRFRPCLAAGFFLKLE
jgi:hypothetical protein